MFPTVTYRSFSLRISIFSFERQRTVFILPLLNYFVGEVAMKKLIPLFLYT